MTRRLATTAALAILLVVAARPAAALDAAAAKERVGLRFGWVGTRDGLNKSFGDGWDATLFFTEAISTHFLFDFRFGAIYLGDMLTTEVDDSLTLTPGIMSQMRVVYFSVGPIVSLPLGGANTGYLSAGVGVYSSSLQFDSGIAAFDYSDQYVGFNGGLGLSRRFANSWCIELNGTVHYFAVNKNTTDLYWVFTGGADDPLMVAIALGVTLDLR